MSTHKITHWIEIPVEVEFEYQPKENSTLTYPGCPEIIEVENVFYKDSKHIAQNGFRSYLEEKYGDEILQACWDHIKGLEGK